MPASFQQLDDDMSWRIREGQKKSGKTYLLCHYLGQVCGIMGEKMLFGAGRRNKYGGNWGFLWSLPKGAAWYIFLSGKQKGSRSFLSSFCLFTFQRNVKAFCGARRLLVSRLIRKINQ